MDKLKVDPKNVVAMLAGLAAALITITVFRRLPSEAMVTPGIPSTPGAVLYYLIAAFAAGFAAGNVVVLVTGTPSLRLGVIAGSLVVLAGLTDVVPFDRTVPWWWGVVTFAIAVAAAVLGAHVSGAILRRRAKLNQHAT